MTELLDLVKNEKWEEAGERAESLRQTGEESEEFMILSATICGAQGDVQKEYEEICRGLQNYSMNYELYYMLGNYYMGQHRSNLAWLCYEQAKHYCGGHDDRKMIEESMGIAVSQPDFDVNPVSIVILAEEGTSMLHDAVESIIKNESGTSYEILVIDNQCMGQALEWLGAYEQVRIISCSKRMGFGEGINIGIKCAQIFNDIYLMQSNAVLLPNTLFWLRMGLYERETIGATGGITNEEKFMQYQELSCQTFEEYVKAAERINVPDECVRENKLWLEPFSLLLRREAVDDIGLFERRISSWLYCVMDYGMRLMKAEYETVLMYNSFIYCQPCVMNYGEEEDCERFESKWKFQILYYANSRTELLEMIHAPKYEKIRVLEVGCGCGSTLSAIRRQYPNARVYGIELMADVAAAGKFMADIIVGNIETMELPYEEHIFDYVIFGDVLEHLRDPKAVIERMKKYLKPDGRVLASIPNVMNIEVVVSLLQGNFTYQDVGLLDRTHIHMFTLREIVNMFRDAGYEMEQVFPKNFREGMIENNEKNRKIVDGLYQLEGIARPEEFEVYQWIVCAVWDGNE